MKSELMWHLEKLPYFLEILEQGSIRKASVKLGIAQPALSKSMQLLEEAAGGFLFHRQKSGVIPTELGLGLAPVAKEILKLSRLFSSNINAQTKDRTLCFVTHEIIGPIVFPALRHFQKTPNKINFDIQTHPSIRALIKNIESRQADCGVVAEPSINTGLHSVQLFSDSFGFFASKSFISEYRIDEKEKFSFEDLQKYPLIWAPEVIAGNNENLAACLKRLGHNIKPNHRVNSLESVIELARLSFGIGIMPKRLSASIAGTGLKLVHVVNNELKDFGKHGFYFCCNRQSWNTDPIFKKIYTEIRRSLFQKQ